jgi:2-C-methyl-D-erythritol 4-phosphate cytidylyltransferase/2-C-methyl-D-erythritol 2,4-cyclodiphosphate synthase
VTASRVGLGYDVHRFQAGRSLRLCGIEIESEVGLEGHSDADVALHAVVDAVLGAAAAGDIGAHFSPTDERWQDADSREFLLEALVMVGHWGLKVLNCDVTVIGERPHVAPHRDAMRASLSDLLGVPMTAVSVKATTTEGLGFAGRREGLAAMAVVLLAELGGVDD